MLALATDVMTQSKVICKQENETIFTFTCDATVLLEALSFHCSAVGLVCLGEGHMIQMQPCFPYISRYSKWVEILLWDFQAWRAFYIFKMPTMHPNCKSWCLFWDVNILVCAFIIRGSETYKGELSALTRLCDVHSLHTTKASVWKNLH
jgi:hypothetical protein